MATPHIESKKEDIAKTVLMPGDPLRAKYIAEHYLENVRLINTVRNMYGYTGTYKGKEVTVFASGMGMPSIGIYSYELFKFYDVENIIRIGSAGAYLKELKLYDVILVEQSYSESSFAKAQNNEIYHILESSHQLNAIIEQTAQELNIKLTSGTIHSSDVFYHDNSIYMEEVSKYHCLACEMESFALFHNAKLLGKNASCILTISDNLVTKEETTSEDREKGLNDMILLALESSIKI